MRNDRNKKKKDSEVSQSVTIPSEIEDVIKMVTKAHNDTFLADPKNGPFSVVSLLCESLGMRCKGSFRNMEWWLGASGGGDEGTVCGD